MINEYKKRLQGDGVRAIIARGATGTFAVKVIGTGIAFGVHILLARLLGADSYGAYIYVFTWMTLFALVGQSGMNIASVRLIADYNANESWGYLRGFIRRSQQIPLVISLTLSLCVALGVWLLRDTLGAEFAYTAWMAAILLSIHVLLVIRASYLMAHKKVVKATFPMEILRPAFLGVTIFILAMVYGEKVDAVSAMGAHLVATVVALLLTSWYLRDLFPAQSKGVQPEYKNKEWIGIAFSLMLVSGYSFIFVKVDTIMVGLFLGTTKAGIYTVATKVSNLINFGYLSIGAIAAPMISQLYSQEKMDELQKMVTFAAQGLVVFSLPVGLAIIYLGESILAFFGLSFVEGYYALAIMSAGLIVIAFAGIGGVFMVMTGRQNEFSRILGMAIITNILLNILLIPMLGMHGAAVATVISWVLLSFLIVKYIHRHFRVNATIIPTLHLERFS